jgi:RING finger and CHY zinc finger domain-containing protein 1
MRHNCPVCFEYLFDSVRPTAVLPCGHTIHSDCLKEMERHRQLACPTCLRSYADLAPVWRRVDEEVAASPMPPEYAAWVVDILCNDCGGRGSVRFHVLGHKCRGCGSYNTRRLGIDRGDGGGGVAEGGGGGGGVGVVEGGVEGE